MIQAHGFVDAACQVGFGMYTGVPCSFLTPIIDAVIDASQLTYVAATNEGDAVALACGAELGGLPSVVMLQNSGLGNAVNPLTSLAQTFGIPFLMLVTWRGQPGHVQDEPQHVLMGEITPSWLDQMRIPWEMFPAEQQALVDTLQRARQQMAERGCPYGILVPPGCVAAPPRQGRNGGGGRQPHVWPASRVRQQSHHQDDVLRTIQESVGSNDAVIATTGYTGRALYALGDHPNQLYMVGSMGCAAALGMGVALAQPGKRVVVIDGDGALMMRMGVLATLGHYRPPNVTHILLDNGVHDSTGGQATNSASTDFATIAAACGYPGAVRIDELSELEQPLRQRSPELTFCHVRTRPRAEKKLPRPSIRPPQVAARFRDWLQQAAPA